MICSFGPVFSLPPTLMDLSRCTGLGLWALEPQQASLRNANHPHPRAARLRVAEAAPEIRCRRNRVGSEPLQAATARPPAASRSRLPRARAPAPALPQPLVLPLRLLGSRLACCHLRTRVRQPRLGAISPQAAAGQSRLRKAPDPGRAGGGTLPHTCERPPTAPRAARLQGPPKAEHPAPSRSPRKPAAGHAFAAGSHIVTCAGRGGGAGWGPRSHICQRCGGSGSGAGSGRAGLVRAPAQVNGVARGEPGPGKGRVFFFLVGVES